MWKKNGRCNKREAGGRREGGEQDYIEPPDIQYCEYALDDLPPDAD